MNKILHYIFLCHRLPERSFHYKGKQFPICARCTGILIGYFLGFVYVFFFKKTHILFEIALIIPIAIDGGLQLLNYWKSNNLRRLITGIMAGIFTISFIRLALILGYKSGYYIAHLIK